WYLKFVLRIVIRGEEWHKIAALLPSNLLEHQEVARLDNTYPKYCEVSADVLLMAGGKSPAFREETLRTLSDVLCNSQIKILPGRDHFAPTQGAPSEVAQAVRKYFLMGG